MNEVERLTTALATMTEEREDAVDSHLNMCVLHAQAKAEVERLQMALDVSEEHLNSIMGELREMGMESIPGGL